MEQRISAIPTAARGPFRIFQMFRFSGCGRDELRADLMTCELGDGRCLAVARMLTELKSFLAEEAAAAVANAIHIRFGVGQSRLILLVAPGRSESHVALRVAELAFRNVLDVRCTGLHVIGDERLREERVPTTGEWPAEWWKMSSARLPLPDLSPVGEMLVAPLVGPTESSAAEPPLPPARESAFGDATIGELLGRVEAKRAAGERVGTPCVEQIPLAQVAPGPEASLADLVAGLVRDDAGGGAAGSFITPRVLDLPWRGFVVLQPCRVRPYWAIYGKLEQDLHPDRLQLAHPLAIDGAPLRLRTELSVRGYAVCEGWIQEAAHRGLEIWRRGPRFEVPKIGDPFPASIVDKINTGTWTHRNGEVRP